MFEIRELSPQPVLYVRVKTRITDVPETIGRSLGAVWGLLAEAGDAPSGQPYTRTHGIEGDLVDLEAGLPVDEPTQGEGEVRAGTLPGGAAAMFLHVGPYDRLPEAGAALEAWLAENGREAAGPRWEVYVTDPGMEPDPEKYETEGYEPLR